MAKDNFCIYCGFKLFPEDHFCPNCGKRLDEGPNAQAKSSKYEPNKVVDGIDLSQVNKAKKAQSDYYSSSTKSKTTYATTTPDYTYYKNQIKKLKESFETKEKKVLELLEKKFPSGQMSYYMFKGEVDSCRVSFFKEAEAAESMIELSDEYSDKIANELKNKIKTLQSIVGKLGDLQSELIISISNEVDDGDEEIKNLIEEMNELINSVKDYEWLVLLFYDLFLLFFLFHKNHLNSITEWFLKFNFIFNYYSFFL